MSVKVVRWRIARRHLNQRHSHRLRWVLPLVLVFLTLSAAGGAGTAAYLFASQLPSASKFHIHFDFQDARIFDARGDLLFNMADLSKTGGRRIVEPLQARWDNASACRGGVNRIPLVLQNATIATEDATFYKNPGFDAESIVRAAYQDFVKYGRIVSGASTITQQLVRLNRLVDPNDHSFNRKAQEVALAYQISKRFSKSKILWYYLNSVPYGNLAIGAQAAARVYFGTQVCRLDLAQAALLAGLPEAPSSFNPVKHRDAALARMRTVLQLLRKHGYIHSSATMAAALRESRGWHFYTPPASMRYPQFVRYVVDELSSNPRLRSQIFQGIDVYTTLDPRLQDLAQRTVTQQINGLSQQHVTNGALVSLDLRPQHYGWILAMVGSAHYQDRTGQINMAISPRQPGSSMKPFNYIWAFSHSGIGPATTVQDSPIVLPDPNDTKQGGWYTPKDYDHQFHGTVTAREALANSLNVPAVKVEFYLGSPKHVAETAYQYGMNSLYRDNPGLDCSVCYAVTLGGLAKGTRLLEETSAYGVFATGGSTVPPVAVWKVVQRGTGRVLYCSEDCPRGVRPDPALAWARRQVLDSAHAYEMTNVLADNGARCTLRVCEFGLNSPLVLSRPAAAKTGTTNDWTDNWTVGYTPQIVAGVWTGNADRTPMINVIGITGAAPIWHDYMEGAFSILHLPVQTFVAPPQLETTNQCRAAARGLSFGPTDVYVPPVQGGAALPLCAVPDRGFLPVPCSRYPARILPLNFRCPSGRASGYVYTYRCTPTCTYTYTYSPQYAPRGFSGPGATGLLQPAQVGQSPVLPPGAPGNTNSPP